MRIAFPGAPGAFSHEACLAFLPDHEAVAVPDFAEVIAAVQGGETEFGLLPVANNEAGQTGAADLITKAGVRIVEEHEMPIRMHLLGMPGSELADIHTVVSHPVALRQCARNISSLGLATEEASNTAVAAAELADPRRAVLASRAAEQLYRLKILKRDMHDRPDNATRFAVFVRQGGNSLPTKELDA